MDSNTEIQLISLKVKNVFIVGGPGVVSDSIKSKLESIGIITNRIYGQNRFETSLQVAKSLGDDSGVVVTNGFGFADALSIAPVAAQKGIPILLTDKDDLSSPIKEFLASSSYTESYIVGGSGVVSDKIASQLKGNTRLGGASRYGTNAAVLNQFADEFNYEKVYVASGQNYPDALSGSVLASASKSPLILVGTSVDTSVMSSIKSKHDNFKDIILLGGASVVPNTLANKIVSGREDLKVNFINVGQGDSILIQTPNGKNMLIDAGTNESSSIVTSYLSNHDITQLDIIAGTHPHEDHIGGMDVVINMLKVGKVYMPKATTTTKAFEDVITAIKNKGLSIDTPTPGTTVDLDPDVKLEILAPNADNYEDLNNYSIVFKLTYGGKSFLFTGDSEDISEKEMISKGYDLKADVLKVGHHGSNSSTTSEFLSAVAPQYAVISVGKGNEYGYPTQDTLDKLKNEGVTVYRTDENGTIIATCDGTSITFNTTPGSYNGASSNNGSQTTMPVNTTPAPSSSQTPSTSTGQGLIKGNINSKGGKIYHVPGGAYYDRTNAEKWFDTEEEAQAAGYRKSLR